MSDEQKLSPYLKLAYTFEEATARCGYSVRTIKYHVADGNLPARYANPKGVIRHEVLADWLDRLPAEPKGGHQAVSRYAAANQLTKSEPPESSEAHAPAQPAKALFRTPEDVAPELGMSPGRLRTYCRMSGMNARLGKNRLMLHEDDIRQLVAWIREHQDKQDERSNEPEHDPFVA